MTRQGLHDEGGWAVVMAVMLMAVMLVTGIALLTVVDVQSQKAGEERRTEAAFTLAEGVLDAQAFALSRAWPELQAQAACTQATAPDPDDGCPEANLVTEHFSGNDYAGATWQTNIHDNSGIAAASWPEVSWGDDAGDPQPSYAADLSTLPASDANGDGKVWVRAFATISGRTRTVVGLARVQRPAAFPPGFGALTGGFSTDLSQLGSNLNATLTIPLLTSLLGNHELITGRLGIRCGVLEGCVTAVGATLNETQLGTVLGPQIVRFGSPAAMSDDAVAQLRQRARREESQDGRDHYRETVASDAACLPTGTDGDDTIFIEKVGDGDGVCTLDTTGNPTAKVLVVANGKVNVTGNGTFQGVIYALNRQESELDDVPAVVTVRSGAHVRGAVFVDGNEGSLSVFPPRFDVRAACNEALGPVLGLVTCTLTDIEIVSTLLNDVLHRDAFIAALVGQTVAAEPAITYDCRYFTSDAVNCAGANDALVIRRNGTAGTIQSTFREVPSG